DEAEVQAGAAPAHPLEQAEGAAVDVVHADDVAAAVQRVQHGGGGGKAAGEGEAAAAAFQGGDAALVGEAGRVVAAAVLEALVHARAGLHVGRGGVDRRHHRARARVGGLAGVDGPGAQAVLFVFAHVRPRGGGGSASAPAQVVQQVDAGDQAEEFLLIHDDGHVAAVE